MDWLLWTFAVVGGGCLLLALACLCARLTARDGSAYRRPRLRLGVERAKVTDLTPDAYRAWRQILED